MKILKLLCLVLIVTLSGCAPQTPKGIYVGYIEIAGDQIKLTLDFRNDSSFYSSAEITFERPDDRDPIQKMSSIINGDEHAIKIGLKSMIVTSYTMHEASWIIVKNQILIYSQNDKSKPKVTLNFEDDGELTSKAIRFSNKPEVKRVYSVNLQELASMAKETK